MYAPRVRTDLCRSFADWDLHASLAGSWVGMGELDGFLGWVTQIGFLGGQLGQVSWEWGLGWVTWTGFLDGFLGHWVGDLDDGFLR